MFKRTIKRQHSIGLIPHYAGVIIFSPFFIAQLAGLLILFMVVVSAYTSSSVAKSGVCILNRNVKH